MIRDLAVAVVIPALDEERTIGEVVAGIDRRVVDRVIVADNGSADGTARRAREAGAEVVFAARKGYGSACLAGIAAAGDADVVVFLDGDGSDDPSEIALLVETLADRGADLVLGSRTLRSDARRTLTAAQRVGNALACALLRAFWGARCTDLGPFRAVRRVALERLGMSDPDMGWTIEMQVKAARLGLRVVEVPVSRRERRAGISKISGSLAGSYRAGRRILETIVGAKLREIAGGAGWGGAAVGVGSYQPVGAPRSPAKPGECARASSTLIILTRYPVPGRVKTRLIPALGAERAAALHGELARLTLAAAREARAGWHASASHEAHRASGVFASAGLAIEVHHDGGDLAALAAWLGDDVAFEPQAEGDLGHRLCHAAESAFARRSGPVVLIGSDCPQLEARHLLAAFAALAVQDVVLGPARDGGYYLIGLSRPAPELFDQIPWGTDRVLARTLEILRASGRKPVLLEQLADIDEPDDLRFLPDAMAAYRPTTGSARTHGRRSRDPRRPTSRSRSRRRSRPSTGRDRHPRRRAAP
ncbi:MAG: TIGR04282 family arsenosugar biosynthesis glycosyltransferase [Deltaproteobacteria bacterium]|nr:TIGR04282 family arsenosugar biosynthesis glycosyltransferase [Deltaproteobacteria bacterium]